ncbi:MAG TPA: hypothetical protein VK778_15860 [Solirubrobacteraceae bacterium]|jgi:hypothetical protein|nr:hypothetical protein [Solirubrobacteraceae bacterium]
MHCRLIALAGLAIALAGCGSSESSSSSTPTAAVSNESATTAASEQPTTASASSEPKPGELTGWGATDAAWNSAHMEDSQFSSGSVYNQNPSLQEINGHTGAEYTAVIHQDGHVLNYYYNFQSKSISEAKAEVLSSQFPTETHIVWFTDKGSCADMLVQSDTLRKALSGKTIGDNEGTALVEFGSGESGAESYDESAVTNALIMLPAGANPSGPSTAPGC